MFWIIFHRLLHKSRKFLLLPSKGKKNLRKTNLTSSNKSSLSILARTLRSTPPIPGHDPAHGPGPERGAGSRHRSPKSRTPPRKPATKPDPHPTTAAGPPRPSCPGGCPALPGRPRSHPGPADTPGAAVAPPLSPGRAELGPLPAPHCSRPRCRPGPASSPPFPLQTSPPAPDLLRPRLGPRSRLGLRFRLVVLLVGARRHGHGSWWAQAEPS